LYAAIFSPLKGWLLWRNYGKRKEEKAQEDPEAQVPQDAQAHAPQE
jgi:hypothetical protein